MPNRRTTTLVLTIVLLVGGAGSAGAQQSEGPAAYRREVFQYPRSGRPDPFRSLVASEEMSLRLADLSLVGVMHDPTGPNSVAVLARAGTDRRVRARVGDRIGTLRVLAIGAQSVQVVVEELGVARRATLELKTGSQRGNQ